MKKNKNMVIIIILLIISLALLLFLGYRYIKQEDKMIASYDDFIRSSLALSLSYEKSLDFLMSDIRHVESSLPGEKTGKNDLIYDFAKYDFIPSLSLLSSETEDSDLLYEAFTNFSKVMTYFNNITHGLRENMLVRQGKYYYTEDKGVYKYIIKKKVITKKGFNDCYKDYLATLGYKDMEDNIAQKIQKNSKLINVYNLLKTKNTNFLQENREIIIKAVAEDLNDFTDFILSNYILADKEIQTSGPELIKTFDTEEVTLIYNFTYLDRIYDSTSKYYKNSYQLDIDYVWEQIESQGYPKLYM